MWSGDDPARRMLCAVPDTNTADARKRLRASGDKVLQEQRRKGRRAREQVASVSAWVCVAGDAMEPQGTARQRASHNLGGPHGKG